jgi:hypothetical protein
MNARNLGLIFSPAYRFMRQFAIEIANRRQNADFGGARWRFWLDARTKKG